MTQSDKTVHPVDDTLSDDALAVARFFRLLLAEKWTIVAAALIAGVLAGVVAWTMEPVYRAETLLSFVDEESDGSGLSAAGSPLASFARLSGVPLGQSGGSRDEAIAVLVSRNLSQEFIDENQLLPILLPDKWDDDRGDWKEKFASSPPTSGEAFKVFDEDVRDLETDASTGLIVLSIESPDRVQAAEWVNGLVAHANERLRKQAISESSRSIEYLQAELAKTSSVELQQVIYRLIESHVQKVMLANVREQYAFKVLDPAVVLESYEFVRPKRLLILVLGILLGGFIGVFVVIVRQAFRQLRSVDG